MSRAKAKAKPSEEAKSIGKTTQELTGQLPATVSLSRAESVSLRALAFDEARLNQEINERQGAIQHVQAARAEILGTIAVKADLTVEQIAENYVFNDPQDQLVLAGK